jgi:hypothetical protein
VSDNLGYLKAFARFPFDLHRHVHHRVTLGEANRIIHERMERREEAFLQIVERSIYGYSRSPYLPLLRMAGCALSDLRALVKQKGLECALRDLRTEGVYITFEEFKGRKPIVRRGVTIPVKSSDFDNPAMRRNFSVQTGGSSGAPSNIGVDMNDIVARAPHELVSLSALGLLDAPVIRWNAILPAGTLRSILRNVLIGQVPAQWFSQIGLRDSRSWLKYGAATYYILFWLRLYGIRVPLPEFVKMDDALVVARAIAGVMQAHQQGCVLQTNTSQAVRVSLAAQRTGLDLRGATFRCVGEPMTDAKVAQIKGAGISFVPQYGAAESSLIGAACAHPSDASDVHLLKDAFVLFTHPHLVEGFGVTVPAFNLTSLLPTATKLMLNLQMDDYGIVEERDCGCPLESLGYTTHLREIRSYSKLTGEGVTLIGNELEQILEEKLPTRFGGSPLDYQLLEQEDEHGFTRAYLVISPRIEITDEKQVVAVMLNALRESSPMADAARTVWQSADTIQVKRMEPIASGRKLHPLHIQPRPEN